MVHGKCSRSRRHLYSVSSFANLQDPPSGFNVDFPSPESPVLSTTTSSTLVTLDLATGPAAQPPLKLFNIEPEEEDYLCVSPSSPHSLNPLANIMASRPDWAGISKQYTTPSHSFSVSELPAVVALQVARLSPVVAASLSKP